MLTLNVRVVYIPNTSGHPYLEHIQRPLDGAVDRQFQACSGGFGSGSVYLKLAASRLELRYLWNMLPLLTSNLQLLSRRCSYERCITLHVSPRGNCHGIVPLVAHARENLAEKQGARNMAFQPRGSDLPQPTFPYTPKPLACITDEVRGAQDHGERCAGCGNCVEGVERGFRACNVEIRG